MALNPAFEQQAGRTLPLHFGYVKGTGDVALFTVTIPGVPYDLAITGEGEMDGKEIALMYMPAIGGTRSGLGTGNGTTSLVRNLKSTLPLFSQLTSGSRFHPGRYGVKGSGMGFVAVKGGHPGVDTWFANFPDVTPPQNLSSMAYEITLGPGPITVWSGSHDDSETFNPTPAPMGVYRGTRCRIFDVNGNVTGYGFTVNPAWQLVEVFLRYKIKPQQPPLAGLTAAEKACFNWPAVVAFAQRNAFLLANGQPRFCFSGTFAADATLTDIVETLLRCSRAYLLTPGGVITPMGDDDRESTFLFSGNHLLPSSLTIDKKDLAKSPNVFIPKYRDLNVPAAAAVVSVVDYAVMGLNSSSPFLPRGTSSVKFVTDGINPFTIGTVMVYGGSTDGAGNPSWDGDYVCAFPYGDGAITDIGVSEDGVTILCAAPGGATGGAYGGYLGAENARFAQRAPTNMRHRTHQKVTGGPDAPGLTPRLNVVPVEYDMGNSTFDQVMRIMRHEMVRTLGADGDNWKAPFTGSVSAPLDSVDANGVELIKKLCGDVITLDEWASPEYAGDYEIQDIETTTPFGTDAGSIKLSLQTKTDPLAYSDVPVEADATYFTVPNAGLDMSDRIPALSGAGTRPYYAMSMTPEWDGADTVSATDCVVWWAGAATPTIYPFSKSGLSEYSSYALAVKDTDGAGTAIEYDAFPGTDFSVVPDGWIPLAVYMTGPGDLSGSGGSYSGSGISGSGSSSGGSSSGPIEEHSE
jgi:hypothetical protein